jgi:hypothetical protein
MHLILYITYISFTWKAWTQSGFEPLPYALKELSPDPLRQGNTTQRWTE